MTETQWWEEHCRKDWLAPPWTGYCWNRTSSWESPDRPRCPRTCPLPWCWSRGSAGSWSRHWLGLQTFVSSLVCIYSQDTPSDVEPATSQPQLCRELSGLHWDSSKSFQGSTKKFVIEKSIYTSIPIPHNNPV